MGARLPDNELAQRVRAANQRRAARLVERQKAAGRVAMTIWVDSTTKSRVDAARRGASLNETAERLLLAGLTATTTPATSEPPTPVYTGGVSDRDAFMAEVGKLLDEGHTGNEIARRLTAAGFQTANGKPLSGANLLRDFRAWCKKNGAPDTEQRT